MRYIGTFDTPEQASAAYTLVRGELDKNSSLASDDLNAVFEGAKARALETAGEGEAGHGRLRARTGKKGGMPRGVREDGPGRFVARIQYSGVKNSQGYIGTFDTPEQASAAYSLVRNELDMENAVLA